MATDKFVLDPDLAAQAATLARKRKMAESLMAAQSQYQLPETKGRMAAKANPLQALVQGLGMYLNHNQMGKLDQQEGALAADMQSRNLAQQAAAKKAALVEALVKVTGDRADPGSVRETLVQEDPAKMLYHQPGIVPTQIGGKSGVLETSTKGEKNFKYEPVGTSVTVGGEKERIGALSDVRGMLKAEREKLVPQVGALLQTGEVQGLLDKGVQTGGGASVFQAMRKLGQAFGVDIPETGLTDALRGNLEQAVMARAKEVAPVTETDLVGIRKALGSIDTDPAALQYLNSLSAALTYKKLMDYQQQVTQAASMSEIPGAYDVYKLPLPSQMQLPVLAGQFLQKWGIPVNTPEGPATFDLDPFRKPAPAGAAKPQAPMPKRFLPVR